MVNEDQIIWSVWALDREPPRIQPGINSHHFTCPKFPVGCKFKIKMHKTVFTRAYYISEKGIFDQFFVIIITHIISPISFNLETTVQ